jgi:symplekin
MIAQAIRDRYTALLQTPHAPGETPSQAGTPAADGTQAEPPDKFRAKQEAEEEEELQLTLGDFRLPPPQKLTELQLQQASAEAVDRMFEISEGFEKTSLIARKSKLGVNRLAASNWDREGWISVVTRLANRGLPTDDIKSEDDYDPDRPESPADRIRDRLFRYIIEDFRGRMDVIVSWLNEEWYIDKLGRKEPQYEKWLMKIMGSIFPFLEPKDRVFMRVLSEIPEINRELLERIKMLCLDPDRTVLGVQMLQ